MLQAIVLGILQGLTEFLPVSSSGHLVLVPWLVGWDQPGIAFSAALHGGTVIALFFYFGGDLWYLITRTLGGGKREEISHARNTVKLLIIGSIPAALAGFFLEPVFEAAFESVRVVASFLLVTAALLILAERIRTKRAIAAGHDATSADMVDLGRNEGTTTVKDAAIIGLAQAGAIFPGISRAGSTMAAGMVLGMSRQGAARFSFLLSIPVVTGAALYQGQQLLDPATRGTSFTGIQMAAGVLAAAVSGFWAIKFLLKFVASNDLGGFARYVALLGVISLIGSIWLGDISRI